MGACEDRRIRKTKAAIKQGFMQLLIKEKDIRKISVRQLTDLVDISRGTFYLHYPDLYELLEEIEQEVMQEFSDTLEAHEPVSLKDTPLPLINDILAFLVKNKDIAQILLGERVDMSFSYKLQNVIKAKCFLDWTEIYSRKQADRFDYYYAFIFSGCLNLFMTWIEGGMKESQETIVKLAEGIMMRGVDVLR
ncbi:MAG: TetR/AcrR family transcriptional regulator [Bacillota bacterium]|nr:TetR/AcrR family transcriptional regulator [Bacillota bacterium]